MVMGSTASARRRTAIGLMLAAVLVASCSSSDSGTTAGSATQITAESSATTTPATGTPTTDAAITTDAPTTDAPTTTIPPLDETITPYAAELDNVDEDGVRSLGSSLKLFALAIAPLPGVDAVTDRTGVSSGTLALRDVLAHYDELTPEQQAAVDAALQPGADTETATVPQGFVPRPQTPIKDAVVDAVTSTRAAIAAKLGDIPGKIDVAVNAATAVFGVAQPTFINGIYSSCKVTISAENPANNALIILNTVGHEVFHCFEAANAKTLSNWYAIGGWLIEGAAEWVGADLSLADGTEANWWKKYLTNPSKSLFARTYDGIGFFSHLAETGTDPWSVFPAMFSAGGNGAAFDASGANSDSFLTSWSSGLFRDPARGAVWDTDGPGITGDAAVPKPLTVANGDNQPVLAPRFANTQYATAISADVLIVQAAGYVRLNDGSTDIAKVTSSTFCTKPGGCGVCPDGTTLPGDPPPLGTDPVVAVSSTATQSSGNLIGLSVEDYCKDQTAVWVHLERPATDGVLAGTVVEFYGCDGPFGVWKGVLRSGGLDDGAGFTVAFSEIPVAFSFTGHGSQSVHTQANGNVPTPIGNITLQVDMDIAIDTTGSTMSITGSGTAGTEILDVTALLPPQGTGLAIEPAPEGSCAGG